MQKNKNSNYLYIILLIFGLCSLKVFANDGIDSLYKEQIIKVGKQKLQNLIEYNTSLINKGITHGLNFVVNVNPEDYIKDEPIDNKPNYLSSTSKETALNLRLNQVYNTYSISCYVILINYFDVKFNTAIPDNYTLDELFNSGQFFKENTNITALEAQHKAISSAIVNVTPFQNANQNYFVFSMANYSAAEFSTSSHYFSFYWTDTIKKIGAPIIPHFKNTFSYFKTHLKNSNDLKTTTSNDIRVDKAIYSLEMAAKNAPLKAQLLSTYTSSGITSIIQNFTSADYYTLTVEERLHCLSVYAGYSMSGNITIFNNNEEGYALKLIRYVNKNELVSFYNGLAAQSVVKTNANYNGEKDNKVLLVKLIDKIDDGILGGENYTKLIAIILNHFKTSADLLEKYMGPSEKELRTIVYYSTDLIPSRSWSMTGRKKYDVALNDNGSLLIEREIAHADYPDAACLFNNDDCADITWEDIDPINDLTIFDLIYFTNCSELSMIEEAGAAKDDELIAPAVILKYCDDKNFNSTSIQAVSLGFDVVTLIAGPGLIKQAINSRKLVMALYEATQLFSAGGNLVVNVSNDPDLLALKQEYDNIMLYWDMANIIGGTGKIFTRINTSVKNGTAKRITKQTGQNFITLYNSAVAAGKTIPTKIKQLYIYLKKKGIDAIGTVNGAGNIIQITTKAITKTRLPNNFINALKAFGKTEDDILEYFTKYHNERSNLRFLNEIEDFISSTNTYNLTKDEVFALWGYTTNYFYRDLNSWLRNGINATKTSDISQILNSALSKLPNYNGTKVFRGIEIDPSQINSFIASYSNGSSKIFNDFLSCGGSVQASFGGRPLVNVIFEIEHITAKEISDLADGIKYNVPLMPKPEVLIKSGSQFQVIAPPTFDTQLQKWIIKLQQIN